MKKNIKGFTLVELLVALAVSGLVMGAVLQVFNTSQQSYVVQEEVAEMQQNLRVAKMFLERDVRMAGSGTINMTNPNGGLMYPLEFDNNSPDGNPGTDQISVVYKSDSGSDCGTPPTGVNSCSSLPKLTLSTQAMPASAATANVQQDLSIQDLTNPSKNYTMWQEDCYCNGTTYTATQYNMPFIITSPDLSQSAILVTTKVSDTGTVGGDNVDTSANLGYDKIPSPGNEELYRFLGFLDSDGDIDEVALDNKLINTFAIGSTVSFFNQESFYRASYYISDNDSGNPCLYRDTSNNSDELIAEYIEDLQANFGLDTNDDGSVDTWVNNSDLTDTQKMQVRLATISLSARSAHEHRNFEGNRPALEDHTAGVDDGFRRRTLTFTVKIRNFGLN